MFALLGPVVHKTRRFGTIPFTTEACVSSARRAPVSIVGQRCGDSDANGGFGRDR